VTLLWDEAALLAGVRWLSERDADLARLYETMGPPPLWPREPGFATMLRLILEQQVSLASAQAVYDKVLARIPDLTAAAFLTLDDDALKAAGFSRQKARYGRGLAEAMVTGELALDDLADMDDDAAAATLVRIKGVGPWTAQNYLLFALRRPDAWPLGDLALAVAAQRVKNLPERPGPEALTALGEPWRPWRAVAARMLWHFYLNGQKSSPA